MCQGAQIWSAFYWGLRCQKSHVLSGGVEQFLVAVRKSGYLIFGGKPFWQDKDTPYYKGHCEECFDAIGQRISCPLL